MTTVRDVLPAPVFLTLESSFLGRIQKLPDAQTITPFRRPVSPHWVMQAWNRNSGKVEGELDVANYSGGNLDNAFAKNPKTIDDLLERTILLKDLSAITKAFDRCRRLTVGTSLAPDAVWSGLRWIRHMWNDKSVGFGVKLHNRDQQRELYDTLVGLGRLVRDRPSSSKDHPGCACWREVVPSGSQSLHLLIGDDSFPGLTSIENERLDQIHIDWMSPCEPTSVDFCEDTFTPESGTHAAQVYIGIGLPDSPFNFADLFLELAGAHRLKFIHDSAFAKAKKLKGEWDQSSRIWAAQGYSGERQAQSRYDQLVAIREEGLRIIQYDMMFDLLSSP